MSRRPAAATVTGTGPPKRAPRPPGAAVAAGVPLTRACICGQNHHTAPPPSAMTTSSHQSQMRLRRRVTGAC